MQALLGVGFSDFDYNYSPDVICFQGIAKSSSPLCLAVLMFRTSPTDSRWAPIVVNDAHRLWSGIKWRAIFRYRLWCLLISIFKIIFHTYRNIWRQNIFLGEIMIDGLNITNGFGIILIKPFLSSSKPLISNPSRQLALDASYGGVPK